MLEARGTSPRPALVLGGRCADISECSHASHAALREFFTETHAGKQQVSLHPVQFVQGLPPYSRRLLSTRQLPLCRLGQASVPYLPMDIKQSTHPKDSALTFPP